MTDYNVINETETDPEAPGTSSLWKRWAKNWIAGFEGAAGAPRLWGQACARNDKGLLTLTIAASSAFTLTAPQGFLSVVTSLTAASLTDLVAQTFTMKHYTGAVRCNASHLVSGAPGSPFSTLSLFKNGTLVQSWTTTSGTAQARTVDVSFAANDVLEWRHKISNVSFPSIVSAVSLAASDAYVSQPVLIPVSAI